MGIDTRSYTVNRAEGNRAETLFVLYENQKDAFIKALLHGDISNYDVTSFFQNNADYVTGLMYIPMDLSLFMVGINSTTTIGIGKIDTTYTAIKFTRVEEYKKLFSVSIIAPFTSPVSFLSYTPYTKKYLYIPFFPLIELPLEKLYGKTLDCYLSLDFWSGKLQYYLYANDTDFIGSGETQIGIEISIGKTNAEDIKRNNVLNTISTIGSLIGTGVGVATGKPLITAGGIMGLTKTVTKTLQDNVEHLSGYAGGNGNRNDLSVDKHVYIITETVKNFRSPSLHLKGKPCRKNLSLSSVTGYTEIGEIHFNPNNVLIYDDEINEITELLRAGVIL